MAINIPTVPTVNGCVPSIDGRLCPPESDWSLCKPWDMNTDRMMCYIDNLVGEGVQIAGAPVHIYKLLGVHEQTRLVDLTGDGTAISGGIMPGFPASNAFDIFATEWRSCQLGAGPIIASAYIGYDFGYIKIPTGRRAYGIDTSIRLLVSTIKIKQSANAARRVTKARVERSEDGLVWYGVAVIDLPNDDVLNTIHFKKSVPSRYWRLRPLSFTGTATDPWAVQALQLFDYDQTKYNNIEDMIFLENRDRDYSDQVITIKAYYDLVDVATELGRFGMQIPTSIYSIRIHFNTCIALLGRPIIIGDIIELPSETQYRPDLTPVKRWLQVNDVTWDTTTYTPGWQPTMLRVTAIPALASQETQDIFGDLAATIVDSSGLLSNDDGNNTMYQDFSNVTQTIKADAFTNLPERGAEGSNTIRKFEDEEIALAAQKGINITKMGLNATGLYVEDAIPPNDAPFTEGPVFPASPSNGDYHRLTFEGLAKDVPDQLWRYSTVKGNWVYLETDRRFQFNQQKEVLFEFLTSPTKKPSEDIK